MLAWLITRYQRSPLVNRSVRLSVRAHHRMRPAVRRPCPLAGHCSATGLAEAQSMGFAALPGILARMAACGVSSDDCAGGDMRIGGTPGDCGGSGLMGDDGLPHYRRSC